MVKNNLFYDYYIVETPAWIYSTTKTRLRRMVKSKDLVAHRNFWIVTYN